MKIILMIICCALFSSAIANPVTPSCADIKPDSPLYSQIPKNFALTTPCPEPGYPSEYRFVGDATVSGNIRYEDTVTFGEFARFIPDEKSKPLLPFGDGYFRIHSWNIHESRSVAVKAFHIPKLKGKRGENCWTAPASIRVKAIWINDNDSDASGNYLTEFTVKDVGKFAACIAETDNE